MQVSQSNPTREHLPLVPLVILAAATFLAITVEMLPTGLMPLMAVDLASSDAQIGLLMTVFALAVVVVSAPLVYALRRVPKRVLLVGVLLSFAVGTIGTALAPSYPLVLLTRVLTGAANGVFWATVTSYTGSLVSARQLTKAVSITGGGGSLAFVLGVPLGTLLGQLLGWRATFFTIAALCLGLTVLLWFALPKQPPVRVSETAPVGTAARSDAQGVAAGAPAARRTLRLVVVVSLLCTLTMIGHAGFYSYISPFMLSVVHLPEAWLAPALFVYGCASAVATLLTGVLFGKRTPVGFVVAYASLLVGVVLVAFSASTFVTFIPGLLLWGIGIGFLPVLLQARLLSVAMPQQRDLASALYTSGFNLGIGVGAFIGGLLLNSFGLIAPAVAFLGGVGAAFLGMRWLDFRLAAASASR